jgi:hypothetical protein
MSLCLSVSCGSMRCFLCSPSQTERGVEYELRPEGGDLRNSISISCTSGSDGGGLSRRLPCFPSSSQTGLSQQLLVQSKPSPTTFARPNAITQARLFSVGTVSSSSDPPPHKLTHKYTNLQHGWDLFAHADQHRIFLVLTDSTVRRPKPPSPAQPSPAKEEDGPLPTIRQPSNRHKYIDI